MTMQNHHIRKLTTAVQQALTDDLRKPQYRGRENCLAGHCYVASEALYWLLGGPQSGWVPQNIQHEGGPHWYLKHKISGAVLDPTASQFKTPVPYESGRGKGFLTKQPSKRTQVVLDRVKNGGLDLPVAKSEPAFRHKQTGEVKSTGVIHDVEKIPDYAPELYEEGFIQDGEFKTRQEILDLEKNHPSPVFPKLGVPDNRRETMIVTTPQAAALKIRQLANATRNAVRATGKTPTRSVQQSNERMAQLYGKAHGASSSHGPTINSYALGEALRNNPRPKDSISTALHEDVHNVFKRIQLIHGEQARHHLARNLMVHMRALDPEYHAAVHDLVNVRNGSEFFKRTTIPAEEAFAHTIDFLNNPRERERYHGRKKHSPEEARTFDSTMKRGYQKLRYLAEQASPDWLIQKSDADPTLPQMPSDHCQAFVQAQGMIRQCKKPVKASGLCYLHLDKIGHFFDYQNEDAKHVEVSSVAVFNSEGYLLMGVRNDDRKWTLPGGKAEDGENPEKCAHRELWEEAGIKIKRLKHLGSGWGGKNGDVRVSVFRGESNDSPSTENDPDKEVEAWEWVDVREGLPKEIRDNLHNGKHDVTLQILGLLEGESSVELSKSWKHAFVGAMTAASMTASPALAQDAVSEDHKSEWTPAGLAEELKPIAELESTSGKKMQHTPHSKGEYHTAFGAVGLKAVTGHEEYKRTKYLQQIYPDLHDQQKFMDSFKSNPGFYNAVATAHWNRLKKLFGGDVEKAAFAWRWGQGKAARTDPEQIKLSPYVQAYQRIWMGMQGQRVAQNLINPLEKKVQEWLAKSLDGKATHDVVLYDLEEDPSGYMTPNARHTDDGDTFYEAAELQDVLERLQRLGYHGYRDPDTKEAVLFSDSSAATIN